MRDIQTHEDIELLMRAFYARAMQDEVIGYLFTEVAQLDLPAHLPIICAFWESLLFKTQSYHGLPVQVHRELHAKSPLRRDHFARWLTLFHDTVNTHFSGEQATAIKRFADGIARGMIAHLIENRSYGVSLSPTPQISAAHKATGS